MEHLNTAVRTHRKSSLTLLMGCVASLILAGSAKAATFTVNTATDAGVGGCTVSECTLREAITAANTAAGADTINFNIPLPVPAGGVFTISPTGTALPIITQQVTIDGNSQTVFTGNTNGAGPEIDLNGGSLGSGIGLRITGPNTIVRGLIIRAFPGDGIQISGATATGNKVEGCFIGVDRTGLAESQNSGDGIEIVTGAVGNIIGGAIVPQRNVISGNTGCGVRISGAGTDNNKVIGNYLGLNKNGSDGLGNDINGVLIESGAGASGVPNTVGGTVAGTRNVIAANFGPGVRISGVSTDFNVVAGNYIGTNASGSGAFPNQDGVRIDSGAKWNTVGGTVPLARNVLSGNNASGVRIRDNDTDNNKVLGNYLGIGADGVRRLGNGVAGVSIGSYDDGSGAGAGVTGAPNVVGGNTVSSRNIISGNSLGVIINGVGSDSNQVQSNFIGTNPAGTAAIPNAFDGVLVGEGAKSNLIFGVPSSQAGAGVPQIISGNKTYGVRITEDGTDNNRVFGNLIGTNLNGNGAIPNREGGIWLNLGAGTAGAFNIIGGASAGARNIISGNLKFGISVTDAGTDSNLIQGNYIGTNAAGTAPLANPIGIRVAPNSLNTNIAGSAAAPQVISGNIQDGISVDDAGNTKITGNYIGTNAAGTGDLGNGDYGVYINGNGGGSIIGGTSATLRNIISGNGLDGVGAEAAFNYTLQGNYIGLNAAGTAALPNTRDGVGIFGGCSGVTIGGATAPGRNVISGNGLSGIAIYGFSISTVVQGNYIGTNFDATAAVGNGMDGIDLFQDANGNTIGGTGAPGAPPGNVISGNNLDGIAIWDRYSYNNAIQSNIIGSNTANASTLGNGRHGVNIFGSVGEANNTNVVGGASGSVGNRIRFNGGDGVRISGDATLVTIRRNSIADNEGLGINLQPDGEASSTVTLNDIPAALDSDTGANELQNFTVVSSANKIGTTTTITGVLDSLPDTPFAIEIFTNTPADPSGYGEGLTLIKVIDVTTDANGHADFSTSSNIPIGGQAITTTVTRTNGDNESYETSEFSAAVVVNDPSFTTKKSSTKAF